MTRYKSNVYTKHFTDPFYGLAFRMIEKIANDAFTQRVPYNGPKNGLKNARANGAISIIPSSSTLKIYRLNVKGLIQKRWELC